MQKFTLSAILALFGLGSFFGGITGDKPKPPRQPFQIYLVGSSVGTTCEISEKSGTGTNLWHGALAACFMDPACHPRDAGQYTVPDTLRVERPDALFELVAENDCRDPVKAAELASALHLNPRVLAVLGHSTSGATRIAGPIYADAGIPLIMPLATAKLASLYDQVMMGGERRLPNYVRLQPSDDLAQAPAIAYVIRRLKPAKVFFLVSDRWEAGLYASELYAEVWNSLKGFDKVKVHLAYADMDAVNYIHANAGAGNVVFYAGSAPHAEILIPLLGDAYGKSAPKGRPMLVLPEACDRFEQKFHQAGFPIYRTGPLETGRCRPDERFTAYLQRIPGNSNGGKLPIATLYGFDAVRLVSNAIRNCRSGVISRNCVLRELRGSKPVAGVCGGYSFRDGENVLSGYHVFWSEGAESPFPKDEDETQRASREITPGDIIRMRAEN